MSAFVAICCNVIRLHESLITCREPRDEGVLAPVSRIGVSFLDGGWLKYASGGNEGDGGEFWSSLLSLYHPSVQHLCAPFPIFCQV